MTVIPEKEQLRNRMRTLRRQLDSSWRESASAAIISRLETLPAFQHAQIIQTYVALRHEVDTHELIRRLLRAGKQVAAPKIALAFDFQIVARIPVEAHDQGVDLIVTEKEIIHTQHERATTKQV